MHKQTLSLWRKWSCGLLAVALASPLNGLAADAEELAAVRAQIAALQERLDKLESPPSVAAEQSEAPAQPVVAVDRRGLVVESADRNYTFRFRPRIQVDANCFPDDEDGTSGIYLRRVRPVFEGKAGAFDWRFMPELAGTVRILDAWGDLRFGPSHHLRVGKFKGVMGYERQQSFSQRLFIEPGMQFLLTPTREIGLDLHGLALNKTVDWTIGVYDGVLDNTDLSSNANFSSSVDIGARVAFRPWLNDKDSALSGLTFGVAFTQGEEDTVIDDSDRDRRIRYLTTGLNRFFRYNDGVLVDGIRQRANLFLSWYTGPFGFLTEYVRSSYDLSRGGVAHTVDTDGWTIQGSWVVTGEHPSYKGLRPRTDFEWGTVNLGAFEVALRIHHIAVGDEAFLGTADTRLARQGSTQEATGYGFGLNWYLSANLLMALNYEITEFSGYGKDRDSENVLKSRVQVDF
jgi:phosphate-selective porin OprO/OprP